MKIRVKKEGPIGRLRALLPVLACCLAALLTGCGKGGKTVASLDGEKISLEEAVFYTRLNQQQWELSYTETFGKDFWTQKLNEETGTFADELKRQVMDTICQIHLMNSHAKECGVTLTREEEAQVEERVQDFMDSHSEEVREAAGADAKTVKRLLTERMLSDKVAEAIVADYEPAVSQEEATLGKMTYCLFSTMGTYDKAGNHQAVTREEREEIGAAAQSFAQRTQELGDIGAAAEEAGRTCIDVYFNENTDGGAHEKIAEKVRTMEPGQSAGPIQTEDGYYVIQYVSERDEQATAEYKEALIQQKKAQRCQEIYEGWLSAAEFSIDQEVWDQVQVDQVLFMP